MSKLTDYGIVLLTNMAMGPAGKVYAGQDLAEASRIPLPTVGKILKQLARAGLVISHRGRNGGYALARSSDEISVAEVINAIEGPIGITECGTEVAGSCSLEAVCAARSRWGPISRAIAQALAGVRLSAMRPGRAFPAGPADTGATT
ncbi:MAG TPA: SUF system Fe-S cluster assembly regulator [Anaeromyxobacteraceae bacterium]|nr:SUF system Fe-S cluster assembly regulator [Anaeromyxobacteraceae bacterium]